MLGRGIEPDFIVFDRKLQSQHCYIVELKDGHEFDTKSSAKEHENLIEFMQSNAETLHYCDTTTKVIGFNAESREIIQHGFKGKIGLADAMTGREFCELLQIDYDCILERRADDRIANYEYFLDELLDIGAVRRDIEERLKR